MTTGVGATRATAARSLRGVEDGLPFRPRHPLGHPLRCRLALEPVTEPLIDAPMVVDMVLLLAEPVVLAGIYEHHEVVAAGAPSEVVELDPLVPIDGAVGIPELHQHRRPELVHLRGRRVPDVRLHVLPERYIHPRLARFPVIELCDARRPVNGA